MIDDVDRGGPDAAAVLSVVAARCAAAATVVIVTTSVPLGLRAELRIDGLSQADLAEALQITDPATAHALWMASRGLPGVALPLARELPLDTDPIVHLALRAAPAARFLDVDQSLIRLLELAAERARRRRHPRPGPRPAGPRAARRCLRRGTPAGADRRGTPAGPPGRRSGHAGRCP